MLMMQIISAMATKKWEDCSKLLGNVLYQGGLQAGPWKMVKIWLVRGEGKSMEKPLSSDSINIQGITVFSQSFCCSAFQRKAFHVFLILEYN